MKVHFIAIGSDVTQNLAITLHKKGYTVTCSDNEFFEPSKSLLARYGLLPVTNGWDINRITKDIDLIIPGMHAEPDNPELIKAREEGIKIMSVPEYLYERTKDKKRIVIAGSHGKTTVTAMIMHVFRHMGIQFDYMVAPGVDGSETMSGLSDESQIAVFEGDEYLTPAVDSQQKFHLYMPDIAVLNGIDPDQQIGFQTFEKYIDKFRIFIEKITPGGTLIYFDGDRELKNLVLNSTGNFEKIPYKVHGYFQNKTGFYAATHNRVVPLKIFGEQYMQNLSAAREVCIALEIREDDFYDAIRSFEGTSGRLQKLKESENGVVYFDYAHSPSEVKATVEAVAERYPGREIISCLELQTYSGSVDDFLPLYNGTLDSSTVAFICFNPDAIELKKVNPISKETVYKAFNCKNAKVYDNSEEMFHFIKSQVYSDPVYLFMSSCDFNGFDFGTLVD